MFINTNYNNLDSFLFTLLSDVLVADIEKPPVFVSPLSNITLNPIISVDEETRDKLKNGLIKKFKKITKAYKADTDDNNIIFDKYFNHSDFGYQRFSFFYRQYKNMMQDKTLKHSLCCDYSQFDNYLIFSKDDLQDFFAGKKKILQSFLNFLCYDFGVDRIFNDFEIMLKNIIIKRNNNTEKKELNIEKYEVFLKYARKYISETKEKMFEFIDKISIEKHTSFAEKINNEFKPIFSFMEKSEKNNCLKLIENYNFSERLFKQYTRNDVIFTAIFLTKQDIDIEEFSKKFSANILQPVRELSSNVLPKLNFDKNKIYIDFQNHKIKYFDEDTKIEKIVDIPFKNGNKQYIFFWQLLNYDHIKINKTTKSLFSTIKNKLPVKIAEIIKAKANYDKQEYFLEDIAHYFDIIKPKQPIFSQNDFKDKIKDLFNSENFKDKLLNLNKIPKSLIEDEFINLMFEKIDYQKLNLLSNSFNESLENYIPFLLNNYFKNLSNQIIKDHKKITKKELTNQEKKINSI